MDTRLVLTKRQNELVKELNRLFRQFAIEGGSYISELCDNDTSLTYYFYNGKNVIDIIRADEYVNYEEEIDDMNVFLDKQSLERCKLKVNTLYGDPCFLLENNQYVKDRILKTIKKVSNTRKQIELNNALGKDGERLANIKKQIKDRAQAAIQLKEELCRWETSGNERMKEITLQDIEANNAERVRLKSEAIKLGKVVAQKTREFLSNYKAK